MYKMLMKLLKYVLIILITIIILWTFFHQVMLKIESNQLEGTWEYVEVNGDQLHVYDSKVGSDTMVLLSGYGTGAPILDFMPLVELLNEEHRVIVIEPLGYGYSEAASTERTVENIVGEIRSVLNALEVSEPVTLIPHSISGIYSMYFASMYPEEVRTIIGIDIAVPGYKSYDSELKPNWMRYVMSYTGVTRLASLIKPDLLTPDIMDENYTLEDQKKMEKLTAKTFLNATVLNEWECYEENINKAMKLSMPKDIPIIIFTTFEDKENPLYLEQLKVVEQQSKGEINYLQGPHYLHWVKADIMVEMINIFFDD